MNKTIGFWFVVLFLTITCNAVAEEKIDVFATFYKVNERCTALAEVGFYGYEIVGKAHDELLSYGNDGDKFDAFYERSLKLIESHPKVRNSRNIFTDVVIEQILKDGIYIWEREGAEYLQYKTSDVQNRINTCMKPEILQKRAKK